MISEVDSEALHRRRGAKRRALRRRRRRGALLTIAVAAIVVAIVLLASSGSSSKGRATPAGVRPARVHVQASSKTAKAPRKRVRGGVPSGRPGTEPIPILMYHVIAPAPAGAPFPGLYVPPAEFAAQMHALERAGWSAVTLDQAEAYWRDGAPLPSGKPIVISFDNGYHSQFAQALPVLRRLGWVGDENIQLTGLPPSQGGLGENEVRGLIAAGWELDTQGTSHADLITLDARELREQVAGTRAILRRRYGVPVDWFCYPSGHYDAAVIAAVKAAGYVGSTTVVPGWADPREDRYRLHRLRVLGGTSPQALLASIAAIREDPPAPASYGGA
jgi:peptidoglycan/xylan/chitin deacetylase (PgdA/CDA1 family)